MEKVSSSNGIEKYPKLSFPGFAEPWTEIEIGKTFKVTRGYVLPATVVKDSVDEEYVYPVYSSQTKDNGLMGYYNDFLYENAITWTTDGANAGTVYYRPGRFYCTNVCGVLLSDEGKANRCVAEILGSVSKKYVSYVGNPKLMNNVMSEIRIFIPPLAEQQKVDALLSIIDLRIKKQQELIEHLKKYKRGVIKTLLSPKKNNRENVIWTTNTIGNLGTFSKGAPLSKANISYSGTPFILYGELYTTYKEVVRTIVRRTQANVDNVYLSKVGDVVIPTSGETPEEISTASCVMVPNVILAGDLNIYRSDVVDGRIMSYLLNHIVNDQIARVAQGKSVVHVQASEVKKVTITYPDHSEQERIAQILELIDKRIAMSEDALSSIQNMKRALLQQLFI